MNKSLLSDQCHRVIFLIQRQDLTDSSSDYVLLTKCHKMLQIYCKEENTSRALSCLKVLLIDVFSILKKKNTNNLYDIS